MKIRVVVFLCSIICFQHIMSCDPKKSPQHVASFADLCQIVRDQKERKPAKKGIVRKGPSVNEQDKKVHEVEKK
jgi:hypothetical protein